jgi:hypothetical protein
MGWWCWISGSSDAGETPLRPSGPPPPKGEDLYSARCSPFGGAVAERLRGSSRASATSRFRCDGGGKGRGASGRRPDECLYKYRFDEAVRSAWSSDGSFEARGFNPLPTSASGGWKVGAFQTAWAISAHAYRVRRTSPLSFRPDVSGSPSRSVTRRSPKTPDERFPLDHPRSPSGRRPTSLPVLLGENSMRPPTSPRIGALHLISER